MKKLIPILLLFCTYSPLHSQVGVLTYTSETEQQFTLFSRLFGNESYLIDNCGRLINSWDIGDSNGLSSELLPNGNLVRGVRSGSSLIQQPSIGGAIEIRNWQGEQIWFHLEADANYIQHHDFAILPNGNIMFLGWEIISPQEQIALGRDSMNVVYPHLWGEYIKEVKPVGNQSEVIWEWHLQDHFVQDFNADLDNYGVISEAPGKIDINFQHALQFDNIDPYHANAVDYDPIRDEVVINLRSIGEFWILDHSTTIEEAASSQGGNSGLGGSIIYRWGNPATYQQHESDDDWKLYGAHGTNFVDPSFPDEGKIILFNNGTLRPTEEYSTIEMISPALDAAGQYYLDSNGQFATDSHEILYGEDKSLFSGYISNAHQTQNGNTFINEGDEGRLLEVNENKEVIWEYVIPLAADIPLNQSSTNNNFLSFVAHRYPVDFFSGSNIDLTPGDLIELNVDGNFCDLLVSLETKIKIPIKQIDYTLEISQLVALDKIRLFSINGLEQRSTISHLGETTLIDLSNLVSGLYVLHFQNSQGVVVNHKFIVT